MRAKDLFQGLARLASLRLVPDLHSGRDQVTGEDDVEPPGFHHTQRLGQGSASERPRLESRT